MKAAVSGYVRNDLFDSIVQLFKTEVVSGIYIIQLGYKIHMNLNRVR